MEKGLKTKKSGVIVNSKKSEGNNQKYLMSQ